MAHSCVFVPFATLALPTASGPKASPTGSAMACPWGEGANEWDCSDDDVGPLTAESASLELFDFLVYLRARGTLSARNVCVIAWLAKEAGIRGRATDLAKKPGAQTGKYSAHIDRVTGMRPGEAEEWLCT